ncbi:MAG TPA: hypothetical protein VFO07_09940 [Roseiflexaceae bacterium]|nr:hypothetical protein [Roseiflexaceae bacterium]
MQPDDLFLLNQSGLQRQVSNDLSSFAPGQQVIWSYRPQRRRREVHCVAAEVVQFSPLRIRICAYTASGTRLLRWVHPKNLRARAPDELAFSYPEPR